MSTGRTLVSKKPGGSRGGAVTPREAARAATAPGLLPARAARSLPPARISRRIQSVDRAVDILVLVAQSRQPLSPSEVAARLGLERTTVHRLMATLAASRLLRFDPERRKYRIGVGAFELGSAYLHAQMEDRVVERIMDGLVREVNHTASLGALVDDEVVIMLARQADQIVTINSRSGDRLAPHVSSIGKLFLAERSDAEVRTFLSRVGMPRLTPHTITTVRAFLAELQEVRAQGVAYAREEAQLGVSSMGVPVRTARGEIAAGLVVAPPAQFGTDEALAAMLPPLRRAAARIEAAGVILPP